MDLPCIACAVAAMFMTMADCGCWTSTAMAALSACGARPAFSSPRSRRISCGGTPPVIGLVALRRAPKRSCRVSFNSIGRVADFSVARKVFSAAGSPPSASASAQTFQIAGSDGLIAAAACACFIAPG